MISTWNTDGIYEETIKPALAYETYRTPFSRARHFAFIVVPVMLGLAAVVAADHTATWTEILSVVGLVIAYGVAVTFLLRGMEKVERMERDRTEAYDDRFTDDLIRHAA